MKQQEGPVQLNRGQLPYGLKRFSRLARAMDPTHRSLLELIQPEGEENERDEGRRETREQKPD